MKRIRRLLVGRFVFGWWSRCFRTGDCQGGDLLPAEFAPKLLHDLTRGRPFGDLCRCKSAGLWTLADHLL